jgi:hypothetical protein
VADLSLDKLMLQDVLAKNSKVWPPARAGSDLEWTYRVSEGRGCVALRFDWSSHRYQSIRGDQAVLRRR